MVPVIPGNKKRLGILPRDRSQLPYKGDRHAGQERMNTFDRNHRREQEPFGTYI